MEPIGEDNRQRAETPSAAFEFALVSKGLQETVSPRLRLSALPPVSGKRRVRMPQELQGLAWPFAVMATIAMLVKHERPLRRWLTRNRRRRKSAYRQLALW